MLTFEFDERKSNSNFEKHGIDFIDAQALWSDPDLLEIQARTDDEARFLVVGLIDTKHWSAVITYREERVRIISVRRSREEEVLLYEG
ncbi:MAG: BrnT family toxin [Pseudomonadales bacterium]